MEWIVNRCRGRAEGQETVLGWMPRAADIDLHGIDAAQFEQAQAIDPRGWLEEINAQEELFKKLAGDMPRELACERELLMSRLRPS